MLLATFCLRLACGMVAALLVLPAADVNPRFYRTQFLTVLTLTVVSCFFLWDLAGLWLGLALGVSVVLSFLGSFVWSVEGAPGGKALFGACCASLLIALVLGTLEIPEAGAGREWLLAGELTSALVLGAATTAMLMGHSYLMSPTMTIAPLSRLLILLLAAILARMVLAGSALWFWTYAHPFTKLNDTAIWLLLRWGVGFGLPLVLAWMARETTKIRSTQSATGILYVAVIFCFLGELTGQLLLSTTGYPL